MQHGPELQRTRVLLLCSRASSAGVQCCALRLHPCPVLSCPVTPPFLPGTHLHRLKCCRTASGLPGTRAIMSARSCSVRACKHQNDVKQVAAKRAVLTAGQLCQHLSQSYIQEREWQERAHRAHPQILRDWAVVGSSAILSAGSAVVTAKV